MTPTTNRPMLRTPPTNQGTIMKRTTIAIAWAASLVAASAGTATAVNEITGDGIADGTITTVDLANSSVNRADLAPGVRRSLQPERVIWGTTRIQFDEITDITLRCPAGQVALNGGVTSRENGDEYVSAYTHAAEPTADGGWAVAAGGGDAVDGNGIANTWVVCG